MARRIVAKESVKCRSGRDVDRATRTLPSLRGGKVPHALSDDEGVAAEDDREMMVPAAEAAPLEVVESQLALHLLVDGLRSPAFLERAHDLFGGHRARQ